MRAYFWEILCKSNGVLFLFLHSLIYTKPHLPPSSCLDEAMKHGKSTLLLNLALLFQIVWGTTLVLTICMDFCSNIRNSSYKQRMHLTGYMSYFSYTNLFVSVFGNTCFQYWSCLCFIFWSAIKLLQENDSESQQQYLNAAVVNHARVLW